MDGTELLMQRWDENQPNTEAFDESCVIMTYYMGEYSKEYDALTN